MLAHDVEEYLCPTSPGWLRCCGWMEHTRSSPIGPAEHEEGGSLQDNSQYSGSSSKKQLVMASGE